MKKAIMSFINWLAGFFTEGKDPDHKILVQFALIIVFCVAFLKKVVASPDIPDIPAGWQLIILCIIGFSTFAGTVLKLINGKIEKQEEKVENGDNKQ
jgi:hypothetical protein